MTLRRGASPRGPGTRAPAPLSSSARPSPPAAAAPRRCGRPCRLRQGRLRSRPQPPPPPLRRGRFWVPSDTTPGARPGQHQCHSAGGCALLFLCRILCLQPMRTIFVAVTPQGGGAGSFGAWGTCGARADGLLPKVPQPRLRRPPPLHRAVTTAALHDTNELQHHATQIQSIKVWGSRAQASRRSLCCRNCTSVALPVCPSTCGNRELVKEFTCRTQIY